MVAHRAVDSAIWLRHAWRNRLHSALLLLTMAGFLALLGWLLWGLDGVLVLVTVGIVGALFGPAFSPLLVMRLYGGRPIDRYQAPALSWLTQRAGLPAQPRLFYVPSGMLNAFAVGTPEQSAIALTDGLLRRLDLREVVGVLAQLALSRVREYDADRIRLCCALTRRPTNASRA